MCKYFINYIEFHQLHCMDTSHFLTIDLFISSSFSAGVMATFSMEIDGESCHIKEKS